MYLKTYFRKTILHEHFKEYFKSFLQVKMLMRDGENISYSDNTSFATKPAVYHWGNYLTCQHLNSVTLKIEMIFTS